MFRILRRMMSSTPTSHFITLPNRPIVKTNGEISEGAITMHYWEWKGHQPTILICHGGTLHGRCFDPIINDALAGYHVISVDFRGHGQSEKHPLPYPFKWFGGDILQFIEQLNLSKNNLIGIGHSLGAHALTYAAALASKQLFQTLVLLDAGIYSSNLYQKSDHLLKKFNISARRRAQWSSVEDMISDMDKPNRLAHWPKETLRTYCTYAIDSNDFKLQCTPELEIHLYRSSIFQESDIYEDVKNAKYLDNTTVYVLRALIHFINPKTPVLPTAPDLSQWFKKGYDIELKDSSHSFPVEQPDIVSNLLKQILQDSKHLRSNL